MRKSMTFEEFRHLGGYSLRTTKDKAEYVARKPWHDMTEYERKAICKLLSTTSTSLTYILLDRLGRR